ncbi:hypothetical protein DHD08_17955 [Arenibacter sp. H213]|nr:hypothetical protein [Arenibacter sp. H213]
MWGTEDIITDGEALGTTADTTAVTMASTIHGDGAVMVITDIQATATTIGVGVVMAIAMDGDIITALITDLIITIITDPVTITTTEIMPIIPAEEEFTDLTHNLTVML